MKTLYKTITLCTLVLLIVNMFAVQVVFGITLKEEEELSKEFLKVLKKQLELIEDPVIESYVNKIGANILSQMPPQPFKYKFYVVKQHVYNAFATPAGHIFINSGLIEAVENEEELAGILAHEIAHVVCRHISQRIDRSPKIGLATLAGVAAGIFIGASGAGEVGNAIAIGSMAAGQSTSLAFSREDELQADQLALDYLHNSGYDAEGLLTSLEKIRNKQWFGTEQVPHYLMTHPASEDRMANIDTWLVSNKLPVDKKRIVSREEFRLVQATVAGKYGDEQSALSKYKAQVNLHPEDPVAHYGYALVLVRVGNREDSINHLRKALERNALNPLLLKELGRIYFLDGQYTKAVKALEGSTSLSPEDSEGLFFLGRTHMQLDNLEKAADVFQQIIEQDPDNAETYHFLGNVYGRQEKLGEAHYYLGIYNKMKGRWKTAEFHLKKALPKATGADRKETIEEMLKTVSKEAKKEARQREE
jgi:predicted Zn-dependent protease